MAVSCVQTLGAMLRGPETETQRPTEKKTDKETETEKCRHIYRERQSQRKQREAHAKQPRETWPLAVCKHVWRCCKVRQQRALFELV